MSGVDALLSAYDIFIFDLDGVVVLGHEPIGGAVEAINDLARSGVHLAYATNNASRAGSEVADLLVSLGITASADEVITSAQASARILADRLDAGAPVLIVGGPALHDEITAVGLTPVASADDHPQAVVQGYAPEVGWKQLAEACLAVRAGAMWVATNADRTLPSPRGELPGNGSLVAALATALDRQPDLIVGKPAPTLFRTAADRVGARKPIVVGDRLDTDITGAVNAGMDSLMVLTGVSTPEDLLTAAAGHRPTYVAADLRGLTSGVVRVPDRPTGTETWHVKSSHGALELDGTGTTVAALATLATAAWSAAGDSGTVPEITAASTDAARALRDLHLTR